MTNLVITQVDAVSVNYTLVRGSHDLPAYIQSQVIKAKLKLNTHGRHAIPSTSRCRCYVMTVCIQLDSLKQCISVKMSAYVICSRSDLLLLPERAFLNDSQT